MRKYLIRLSMELIDARLLEAPCPECTCRTARLTYAVMRRRLGSTRTDVVSVNDVIACEDTDMCNWSVPTSEVAA